MDVSVVIPVRNRWDMLFDTLGSLKQQSHQPLEVIVVDDGSTLSMPQKVRQVFDGDRIKIINQGQQGISAARNAGISAARGDMILFIDSDCVLHKFCIQETIRSADIKVTDVAFQLAFLPATGSLVWRIDGLGKNAKQQVLRLPSGYTRYLDTGGFAIRRTYAENNRMLFDVAHLRGEDTALLCKLIGDGHMPRFVDTAFVEHRPSQSCVPYVFKQFISGYQSSPARAALKKQACALLQIRGRMAVLLSALRTSRERDMGILPLILLLVSYFSEISGRLVYALIGMRPGRIELLGIPVDCLHSQELRLRIICSAEVGRPSCFTYLTAWSMVQAQKDLQFKKILHNFDIVYADGMGVVLAAFMLRLRRIKKVTANEFFIGMCDMARRRALRMALIGSTPAVVHSIRDRLLSALPGLQIVLCSAGYLSESQKNSLIEDLENAEPQLVVLAMGQPLQEVFALRLREVFPRATYLCVGGLFDYIAGVNSTPPRIVRICGFEWVWRLVCAPRRMWRRYAIGLPELAGYILREYVRLLLQLCSSCRR